MNKKLFAAVLLAFFSGILFAADKANPVMVMKGYIIDNNCAVAHMSELSAYIEKHTKECALLPDNFKSGYSLYTGTALLTFDEESSEKAAKFLKRGDSKLSIEAKVELYDDKMRLLDIKSAK